MTEILIDMKTTTIKNWSLMYETTVGNEDGKETT